VLQEALGTAARAQRFHDDQTCDVLVPSMQEFIARMTMAFVATSDAGGECDSTLRAGPPGFLRVLDERHVAWPEYRGNGVLASRGNIVENPHVGLLFVDFVRDTIGLHVNGTAMLVDDDDLRRAHPDLPVDPLPGRRPEQWVVAEVDEAYIHCSKHIPRLHHLPGDRRLTHARGKKSDYFVPDPERPAAAAADTPPARPVSEVPGAVTAPTVVLPVVPPDPDPAPASRRGWWRGLRRRRRLS
jgi:predicted pyridoxine 5'-phosphate oxidase superfamily flavin-nucleotide-binding protein